MHAFTRMSLARVNTNFPMTARCATNGCFIRLKRRRSTCSLTGNSSSVLRSTRSWSCMPEIADYSPWYTRVSITKLIHPVVRALEKYVLCFVVYCLSSVVIFMSISFVPQLLDVVSPLNESRPMLPPYPGYYFVDHNRYFVYIFWHSVVAFEIIMAGIVAHDCMFVTYVEHVCNIFAVLG